MDIKDLMSGIAVVIDDAYGKDGSADKKDKIFELVKSIENKWKIPFYKTHEIPSDEIGNNLLQSASFILLDWKLWPSSATDLERDGIENNISFLKQAKDYFVPVFIFTNESEDDITDKISELYDKDNPERNFIFIKNKTELASGISKPIKDWLQGNASVYTLKTWEQTFYKAKRNLFSSMYDKSPDWPKVFWKAYEDDGVAPSSSMTRLINDSVLGRMETGLFEEEYLSSCVSNISSTEIKSIITEASFVQKENLSVNELRAGDLFKQSQGRYLLNIRPDCDCVPRSNDQEDIELYCIKGERIEDIELYCIKGERIGPSEIKKLYDKGSFNERVSESIVFAGHDNKTIKFNFKELRWAKYSEIKDQHVGRLIHPHITRIQQRYSAYLQRQGLPRIPREAIEIADGT